MQNAVYLCSGRLIVREFADAGRTAEHLTGQVFFPQEQVQQAALTT